MEQNRGFQFIRSIHLKLFVSKKVFSLYHQAQQWTFDVLLVQILMDLRGPKLGLLGKLRFLLTLTGRHNRSDWSNNYLTEKNLNRNCKDGFFALVTQTFHHWNCTQIYNYSFVKAIIHSFIPYIICPLYFCHNERYNWQKKCGRKFHFVDRIWSANLIFNLTKNSRQWLFGLEVVQSPDWANDHDPIKIASCCKYVLVYFS